MWPVLIYNIKSTILLICDIVSCCDRCKVLHGNIRGGVQRSCEYLSQKTAQDVERLSPHVRQLPHGHSVH